jgi:hypothetical protein
LKSGTRDFPQIVLHHVFIRGHGILVFDELVQYRILVVRDAGFQGNRFLGSLQDLGDFRNRGLELFRKLMHRRLPPETLRKLIRAFGNVASAMWTGMRIVSLIAMVSRDVCRIHHVAYVENL